MSEDDLVHRAERLSRRIGGLLAGTGTEVQGVVLADLTAIWLCGHRAGDPDATQDFRAEILSLHCAAIRKLVRLHDKESQ